MSRKHAVETDHRERVVTIFGGKLTDCLNVGDEIADAIDWECSSCREDVGWADWTSARKGKDDVITLHVECGHCGSNYTFDAEGNLLDQG